MSNQRAYYANHRVQYEFRKSKKKSSQVGIIYARIYVEGQKRELHKTGIRCRQVEWENRTAEYAGDLNEKLVLWDNALGSASRALLDRGEPITASGLIAEKNYLNQPLLTLEAVFELFQKYKKSTIGDNDATQRRVSQISPNTYRTYAIRWKWVSLYLKKKGNEKMLAQAVDPPFIKAFSHFLATQPMGDAFATKCVKMLTEVLQWAFNEGHIRAIRTGSFRGTGAAVKPPYNLTEEEVSRLESVHLTPDQARVRDGWLLARELCLHFSDYLEVKPEHFSLDQFGRLTFEKYRVKQESGRNIRLVSLVSERANRIWQKYGEQIPACLSNPHMGRVLVDIGKLAGLERRLTFSHARDSGIFRHITSGYAEQTTLLAAGWTTSKQLTRYLNRDRRLLEELTRPTSPQPEPTEPASSDKDRLTPDRHNPFLHIYKAS